MTTVPESTRFHSRVGLSLLGVGAELLPPDSICVPFSLLLLLQPACTAICSAWVTAPLEVGPSGDRSHLTGVTLHMK